MTEPKFTPGPWNWESQNGRVLSRHKRKGTTGGCTHNSIYAICNLDDGEYIVYEDEAELEANARLITAAPEMYDELKRARDVMQRLNTLNSLAFSLASIKESYISEISALLEQINGEESK
jgi:hypothetical protein